MFRRLLLVAVILIAGAAAHTEARSNVAASWTVSAAGNHSRMLYLTRHAGSGRRTYLLTVSRNGKWIQGYVPRRRGVRHVSVLARSIQARPKRMVVATAVRKAAPARRIATRRQPTPPHTVATASSQPGRARPRVQTVDTGSFTQGPESSTDATASAAPQPASPWTWAIQCVAIQGATGIEYRSYYSQIGSTAIGKSSLPLPNGGTIVYVSADRPFSLQDDKGAVLQFAGAHDAVGKSVGPGNWSAHVAGGDGISIYLK